ncbi:NmrA/HSCARG family protein [Microvirga pakistanensis]|uniref:NmrA/HSCARG family protein n=1 Tax=Microvirga pakistanensis TaxID=1682650 RepID=UPI001069AA5D|nr:NmrA/HSCARG family protein [Microvirga pakistanensis]
MADKKIIAVVGATGAQGGGLARAILGDRDGEFAVRALTRDGNAPKAKELASLGAEVVATDIDDEASVRRAFEGAYGAYCVTFFWDHYSPEKEVAQARIMARAAKDAGLKHVVWSTLEDTRLKVPLDDDRMPTLGGRYKVPHFDGKGEADHLFTDLGVPVTFLLTSFYWDNFIHFGMGPQKTPDGRLAITMPMGDRKLAGIAAEDIGKAVYGIFKRGDAMIGKTVGIAGGHLTGDEMAQALGRVLGRDIVYNAVTPEAYRGFGFPGADDLGNMFQYYRDFEADFRRTRDLDETRALNPEVQTFDAWIARNGKRIPLPD